MNLGKCPKCENVILYVNLEAIDVRFSGQSKWKGVSYCCPRCNTVLSVAIDPIAIKSDIVRESRRSP